MIPLRSAGRVVEAGCGTGLILGEVASLTEASVAGIDHDPSLLAEAARRCPAGVDLVEADALESSPPRADIYLFHHFLLHSADLPRFLVRVREALPGCGRGIATVLAEYDWTCASAAPPGPFPNLFRRSLAALGLHLRSRAEVEASFESAGFRRVASGCEPGIPSRPDEWFVESQAALLEEKGDPHGADALRAGSDVLMVVPLMWSVWRTPVGGR
ncbi:class I SAM-dependent methyltransferase [Candidatus Fermentibacteria bacterium]|nr:class I SAM-dependent methyltransferase [Candidatus Fermentibacteria bacterium]